MSRLEWTVGENADILDERQFRVILLANTVAPLGSALLWHVLD